MPILSWLPAYSPAWLRFDLVAGLTAAAVVIPQAMAYAAIAGLAAKLRGSGYLYARHGR
jgi:MFS superfamily sulfate permease-like transporter